MIHYIYRIDFLCGEPGRYYLGKRSFPWKNIENDSYAGSGNFCKEYYKKYGKILGKTYNKTIIEINSTIEENRVREEVVIGDLWKTDPLYMNQCPGGSCNCFYSTMREVVQYDVDGNIINVFNSITEATDATGMDGSSISECCNGHTKRKIVGGFIWRYYGDDFNKVITPKYAYTQSSNYRKINQYTIDGEFIKTWDCLLEIKKALFISTKISTISKCLEHKNKYKTSYGYRWEYYNGNTDNIEPLTRKFRYPVLQYNLNGNLIKEYSSCKEAAIAIIGNHHGEKIKKCAEGLLESAHGYKWKFKE